MAGGEGLDGAVSHIRSTRSRTSVPGAPAFRDRQDRTPSRSGPNAADSLLTGLSPVHAGALKW
jgi:hypothetical protein